MVDYDMENLEKVWRRVSPPAEEPGGGTGGLRERLAGLIRREAAGAAMYTLLAIKSKGGPAERVFKRAAEDERRHNAELERYGIPSESALIDGDKGNFYPLLRRKIIQSWQRLFTCPPRPGDMAQGTLWELRQEWVREVLRT